MIFIPLSRRGRTIKTRIRSLACETRLWMALGVRGIPWTLIVNRKSMTWIYAIYMEARVALWITSLVMPSIKRQKLTIMHKSWTSCLKSLMLSLRSRSWLSCGKIPTKRLGSTLNCAIWRRGLNFLMTFSATKNPILKFCTNKGKKEWKWDSFNYRIPTQYTVNRWLNLARNLKRDWRNSLLLTVQRRYLMPRK